MSLLQDKTLIPATTFAYSTLMFYEANKLKIIGAPKPYYSSLSIVGAGFAVLTGLYLKNQYNKQYKVNNWH